MPYTAQAGSLDLQSGPYRIIGTPDFPDARLNDFGRAAQKAGAYPCEAHYDFPPWQFAVGITDPTRALVDALANALRPGARLLLGGETGTGTAVLETIECGPDDESPGYSVYTFSGTRRPGWEVGSWAVTGTIADGWGTLSLGTLGGTLAARIDLALTCAASSTLFAAGVMPDPGEAFDPIDDYSGTTVAGAFGGEFSANTNLSATPAALGSAPGIDVAANAGTPVAVARVRHTANACTYQATSAIALRSALTPPVRASVENGTETLVLGTVNVPAFPVPVGTSESAYTAPATDWNQTAEDTTLTDETPYTDEYAFTVTRDRLDSITLKFGEEWTPGAAEALQLYRGAGTEEADLLWVWTGPVSAGVRTFSVGVPVTSGETLTLKLGMGGTPAMLRGRAYYFEPIPVRFKNVQVNAGYFCDSSGALVSNADLYLVTKTSTRISFAASTPVRASSLESGKTAGIDVLARIPAVMGAPLCVSGSFGSGTGVKYDSALGRTFPCDATGVTGIALSPSYAGSGLLAAAGVPNTLVVATGAVADVTFTGTVTELRLHRG